MASATSPAASLLKRQLKEMQSGKDIPGISCGLVNDQNIFVWEVMLMISDDCKYYGGILRPSLTLPLRAARLDTRLTCHRQEETSVPTSSSRTTTRTCRPS